jgi:two-component system, chemotaxis family, protein-glutamate methylesterase/glutaminase
VARRDVVVIGASAGGVQALATLVSALPPDFPAAVLVVLHTAPTSRGALASILDRSGPLPARPASEGEAIVPGCILVAPPDRHLVVVHDHVTLSRGPRENGHRPAVDVLFRSAARALAGRVVAVVLSGTLDDGAAGSVAVHQRGGRVVVQDPETAAYPGMPLATVHADGPADVLPLEEIAELLCEAVREEVPDRVPAAPGLMSAEVVIGMDPRAPGSPDRPGEPSGFSCPECNGVLFEIDDGPLRRFRCRVGHAWSLDSLEAQQALQIESALWMALQALEERAALADRLMQSAQVRGHRLTEHTFAQRASEARESALVVRELIAQAGGPAAEAEIDLEAGRARGAHGLR